MNSRYQIWSRLEENGHINMKILPSQIEFTLPSPKVTKEDFFLLVKIFFFFSRLVSKLYLWWNLPGCPKPKLRLELFVQIIIKQINFFLIKIFS